MVDIFDEVADDLRAERAARLLRRYGGLLVAAAILILLAVAGQQAWHYELGQRDQLAATAYLALTGKIDGQGTSITNDQRIADAKALESFASSAPAGYRGIAILRAAALYQDAGQAREAAGAWNEVAGDPHIDPLLRDLADLLWAQHELGQVPDAAIAARLAPLTAPENPYHALAQETQALMDLNEGQNEQAKALLGQLATDPGAPDGVRNRADGLLAKLKG